MQQKHWFLLRTFVKSNSHLQQLIENKPWSIILSLPVKDKSVIYKETNCMLQFPITSLREEQ